MSRCGSDSPNILLIHTDQQRGDCLGVEGHPVLLTPNMDNIAAQGVRFSHFYSPCPTCIATRRSIMSGQYPRTHGMVGYRDGQEWDPPATLPGVLKDHGYQTMMVGRGMHLHPPDKPYGFEVMLTESHTGASGYTDWLKRVGPTDSGGMFGGGIMHNDWTAKPWHLAEHLHFTNWVVTRALEFIEERDSSRPLFMAVGFIAPHPPLQPPAFYMERYLRTGVPDPVIGDWAEEQESVEDYDPVSPNCDTVAPNRINLTGEALLCARAGYYGLINHVDDQLRRLLNPVNGVPKCLGKNTIVVFTSDHGEMLGDHYWWRKAVAFEPSARVPFMLSGPERYGLRRGSTCDAVATHADIMPTLLDMAGVGIPDSVEGRSLLPLMQGAPTEWREFVHIEHAPYHQAVTDGREKFIWSPKDDRELFFDLTRDPAECRNLIADPNWAERIALWRQRLIDVLRDRPEGFVRNDRLSPVERYDAVLPVRKESKNDS